MADKIHGVVVAVHYKKPGEIDWVRAFEARGATFSDHVMIRRAALIEKMKTGKRFVSGKRKIYEASNFDFGEDLSLAGKDGAEVVVIGSGSDKDDLKGVPLV
jgi:hypothetical protein